MVVFSITLVPMILFIFVTWNRISLPFVFEWGESAGVNQISRILTGADLFAKPTLEFSALVYTPLYYFVSAGLSAIIGNPLFSARIISLVSTAISVVLIGFIVRNQTKNNLLAWISGMFYLACFALSDGFYDLARVDSLYILVVLIAFIVALRAQNKAGYLLFGLLVVIGFFVKQSFIIVFIPLHIYLLLKYWKNSWTAFVLELIGLSVSLYLINRYTNNWFFYYIFDLPQEHGYSLVSAIDFWIGDTINPLGIVFIFFLVYILASKFELMAKDPNLHTEKDTTVRKASKDRWWFFLLFFAGAAGAAWVTRASNGGGANNCMLIYAALAISLGLGAGLVLKTKWVEDNQWFYALIMIAISIQFIGLIYNPLNFLPTDDEKRLNERISERIKHNDIQVLIPYRSHLADQLSGNPQIHIVNLFELTGYFKGDIQPDGYALIRRIRTEICQQSYGLIILDQPLPWFEEQINHAYLPEKKISGVEYHQSNLLKWQQGISRTYLPRENFHIEQCLRSISGEQD